MVLEYSTYEILNYETYEEAVERFDWDDRWEMFDGTRENFNIAHECIDRHNDDATAVRLQHEEGARDTYTFGELRRESAQFANALEASGVDEGDRVAVMLDPSLELYVAMFGILKRGAVMVQLSPMFGPDAINYRIDDSGADCLVTASEKLSVVSESEQLQAITTDEFEDFLGDNPETYDPSTAAEDVSIIQYTSGTTGKPDGTEMRHKSVTYVAVRARYAYGILPEDRFFCTSSPSWAHGLWIGTFAPLALGNALGAYEGAFDVKTTLEGLEQFEITNLTAAATALRKIINYESLGQYDLSLERVATAGEKIDKETQRQLIEELGVSVADIYGVSEFGGIIMNYNGFRDWEMKIGSIGKPFPGIEVGIIDDEDAELSPGEVGEIAVRRGNEWFRTGDSGTVDEDGYYWFKGRKDDVIISAGYRIDPYEVEDTLMRHPAVEECAVVGVSDEERGSIVKAYVRTSEYPSDQLEHDIVEFTRDSLSKHEYPRELEFVDEFPRTEAGGKIKYKELGDGDQ